MEKTAALAALAALAQESRLDIYRLLVQAGPDGMPAGQIGEQLGLPSATLAFHLKELKNAGLATATRNGRSQIYAAAYSTMNTLLDYLTENCCQGNPAAAVSTQPPDTGTRDKAMDTAEIKEMVRARYGGIAAATASDCCAPSCCDSTAAPDANSKSLRMGYSADQLAAVPDGANLGLGCGNPQAIAAMKPGETVVDLGSGAGFDCLLAARQVGPAGRVIGIDMTHEMLAKARENAAKVGAGNVEFRLGEIEHLPVADSTADVILSNCVINLVPDKAQVFREAFRVLKPGGRLAISDVVNTAPLSPELAADRALVCGCVAGAAPVDRIQAWLGEAGFTGVRVTVKPESREMIATWAPGRGVENFVASAIIEGCKPAA
jgi:SAM-dependent methyltransferase/DNA-binding transcriptional ArsR family regulator